MKLFAFGFRPFFLFGAISSITLMGAWVFEYVFGHYFPTAFGLFQWHAHEMLFGSVAAIIAGFLLTAPATWTGLPMPAGWPLFGLVLLWLAARILPLFPDQVPFWTQALVDIAFLPAIALFVARVVWKVRQWQNMVFPALLLGMTAANGMAHAGVRTPSGAAAGTDLMIYLVLLLIAVLAGRVIPFFVKARLNTAPPVSRRWVEVLSIGTLVLLAAGDLLAMPPRLVAMVALCAALAHAVRLARWHTPGVWGVPLLWVLFLAYGWLVVGLAMKAWTLLAGGNPSLARHALTVGAIGGIALGMMCRVTLGHTGRPMRAPPFTVTAFVLINAAAAVRVFLSALLPSQQHLWLKFSAAAWIGAFLIYLLVYSPMLFQPRKDGLPG